MLILVKLLAKYVRRLNQSLSKVVSQSKFPAGLGALKNG